MRELSVSFQGFRLFNILPRYIRDLSSSVEVFKKTLDLYLCEIEDMPRIPGYNTQTRAESNSVHDTAKKKTQCIFVSKSRCSSITLAIHT